jgi:hypothetical protein
MSTTPTNQQFPRIVLTPIVGVPTSGTIGTLTAEIYAHTRGVYSASGGGTEGHLAIAMSDAAYLVRSDVPFVIPVHPGEQADPPAAASGPAVVALNRAYDKRVEKYATYANLRETVKGQILKAVDPIYVNVLRDPVFGFADVTILQFLEHLRTNYGVLNASEIEANRNKLSEDWNPDQPIENLWTRITVIRDIATNAGSAITDATSIQLTLAALRKCGVYDHAITTWEDRPTTDHTFDNFHAHFVKHDKLRLQRMTAQTAGFHGANQATPLRTPDTTTATQAHRTPDTTTTANQAHSDGIPVFYCWSHGLGKNPNHTSATCSNQKEGHKNDATIFDRKGGNGYINCGTSGRPPRGPRA